MCCVKYVHIRDKRASNRGIYVRKSREKSFWKKNLEIKTLEKNSEFYQVLGKNVTGKKILRFGFPGHFFLKKVLENKVSNW